jgi:hypothetical protein
MTRHVSTENLARFRAGDLSTARSTRVAAHLRSCARCRETSDALAQVPSLLASVEVPPMPAHLAARIESALAAESAHRTASAPAGSPGRSERPERAAEPARARRRHRRPVHLSAPALRVLAVAGAAVVLVGGVVELLNHSTGPSAQSFGTSSGSGASRQGAGSPMSSAPKSGTAANGGSFGRLQYSNGTGHPVFVTPLSTGTNYSTARLTRQVNGLLATHGAGNLTAGPAVTPAHLGMTRPQHLGGCVSRIADGRKVLLVDVAKFDGKPATIIVTARQGSAAAQVWVVGSGCSASVSDIRAHQTLPGH